MEKLLNILAELRENNIKLVLTNGELDVVSYGGTIEPHLIEKIKTNKQAFIDYLTLLESSSSFEEAIPVQPIKSHYPLSNAQRRLWLLCQHEEESRAYHMPSRVALNGNYNLEHFQKAVLAVIERHEITRTVFLETKEGDAMQRIQSIEEFDFSIGYEDFRSASNAKEACQAFIDKDNNVSFDLFNGPLLRAYLLHISNEEYVFYFNMHHIISDGWSMDVMSRDVMTYYNSYQLGVQPELPELKIQYKDYAVWQLNEAKSTKFQGHKNYWLDKLSGEIPVLDLPTKKQRPSLKTYNGEEFQTYLSEESTTALKGLVQEQGGSLFTGLLAIWNVLIHKYTGLQDILIGSPVSGRDHSDLSNQIGFYVNTLALRNKINPEVSFESFYESLCASTITSFEHQSYSFDQLVEDLNVKGDPSRSVLFDAIFTLQNSTNDTNVISEKTNRTNEIVSKGTKVSKFDLQIIFREEGDQLSLHITYNTDVYEAEMIQQIMRHFKQLLASILEEPTKRLRDIDYLSINEKVELLESFNNTRTDYPENETIINMFRNEANKTPNGVALVFKDKQITYGQLEAVSNQLAHFLLSNYEINKGDFIGIMIDRSEWSIISLLAVLKTASTYVPLDVNYPKERIDFMQADTNCELIITSNIITQFIDHQENYPTTIPEITLSNKDLAYVMYTSGSTGKPKGVMVEQKSIVRLVKSTNYFNFTTENAILSTGSFSFDATTFEFFGSLLNGAKLVMTSTDTLMDLDLLKNEIVGNSIDVMWFTSGWLNQIVDTDITVFTNLKTLLVGGDKLSPSHIKQLRDVYPSLEIINGYGPTENTTFSLTYTINEVTGDLPIGFPISNSHVYILDQFQQLVPKGVCGELYLGGDGLSRGYLNRPNLTKEKFVANPFKFDEVLYRTGDLGRWNNNGSIDFQGRTDNQVKINGHRIELGEIESIIATNTAVSAITILAEQTGAEEKQLIAYFTAEDGFTEKDLRSFLKEVVPSYMIPNTFQKLEVFPLTSNGKVDRKALSLLEKEANSTETTLIEPVTDTELQLAAIFASVLKVDRVGINESFFELGGNSLKVFKLLSLIQKEFQHKIEIKKFYANPTITGVISFLESQNEVLNDTIVPIALSENGYTVSNEQLRIWIASQTEEGSVAHHMISDYVVKGALDVTIFKKAIEQVVNRHEALRTFFSFNDNGEVVQFINNDHQIDSIFTFQANNDQFEHSLEQFKSMPFNLAESPLFRVMLIETESEEFRLTYVMHHIIGDFGSFEILFNEIAQCYDTMRTGKSFELTPLEVQNKDYVSWIKNKIDSDEFKKQRNFFNSHLESIQGKRNWIGRNASDNFEGDAFSYAFDDTFSKKINDYSLSSGRGMMSLMSSALSVLIHKISGQRDVIIGLPVSLRNHPDLNNQVGLYLNMLPLRVTIDGEEKVERLLDSVSQYQLYLMEATFFPFDMILDNLEQQSNINLVDRIDVYLNIIHQSNKETTGGEFNEIEFVSKPSNKRKSKFPICFYVYEFDQKISYTIEFQTDLFNKKEIERISKRFNQCLERLLEDTKTSIDKINLVDTTSIPTFNF